MTQEHKSALIRELESCIKDSIYKALSPFQLANVIFKEIMEPTIEDEVEVWIKLFHTVDSNPQ